MLAAGLNGQAWIDALRARPVAPVTTDEIVVWMNRPLQRFIPFNRFFGVAAISFCLCGHVCADGLSVKSPVRSAQCLLEVKGAHYLGGDCLFAPLDRTGSFQITAGKRFSALVKVKTPGHADVSWSGPTNGGDAAAVLLGGAFSNESGCWIVDPSLIPTERTLVCAWDKNQRLFLSPMPADPPASALAWGERHGMNARILSSAGLGTENARVTAIKDRNGAVDWCRQDYDYSLKCIENTLKDTGLAPGETTLHANCKTKRFTDFWGRNLKALDGDILNLDTNQKLGSSTAAGSTVAQTAFETLCPEEAK